MWYCQRLDQIQPPLRAQRPLEGIRGRAWVRDEKPRFYFRTGEPCGGKRSEDLLQRRQQRGQNKTKCEHAHFFVRMR